METETDVKILFGKRIIVSAVLKREWKLKSNPKEQPYPGIFDKKTPKRGYKFWDTVEIKVPRYGIFLGYRTLFDGFIERDYDEGDQFTISKHYRVALVCLSERENPVYVPLNSIK